MVSGGLKEVGLKGFRGFTLAEVLIALVIIGVIAAMTIPTLINKTNKQEYVSRLLKTYSTLGQGLNSIWQNNGVAPGDYEFFNDHDFIDEFSKVVGTEKICDTFGECTGTALSTYKFLNKTSVGTKMRDGRTVILPDGQVVSYVTTVSTTYGLSAEDADNVIGRILVDVNGSKKPNMVGADVFNFYLIRGRGIVPAGMQSWSTCKSSGNGYGCAAKVLKEKTINYI